MSLTANIDPTENAFKRLINISELSVNGGISTKSVSRTSAIFTLKLPLPLPVKIRVSLTEYSSLTPLNYEFDSKH